MPEHNPFQALLAAHVKNVRRIRPTPRIGNTPRYYIVLIDEKTGRSIKTPFTASWLKESARAGGVARLGTLLKGLFALLDHESRTKDRRKFI